MEIDRDEKPPPNHFLFCNRNRLRYFSDWVLFVRRPWVGLLGLHCFSPYRPDELLGYRRGID